MVAMKLTRKHTRCNLKNITRKLLYGKIRHLNKGFNLFDIHYNEPDKKDMAIGLVYFNSSKSKRLLMNYLYTVEKLKMANMPIYTVEMYKDFPEISDAIHVKTDFILFQKERLCHFLEKHIPKKYTKIVFLDTDVIFDNINWYNELSEKLNTINIVQPFTKGIWLDLTYKNIVHQHPGIVSYFKYGGYHHTGFGWAFQREWFCKYGFFQYGILGSGDFFNTSIWLRKSVNEIHSQEVFTSNRWKYIHPALEDYAKSIKEWPTVCYIKGNIYHLFHGNLRKRQYLERNRVFKKVKDVRDILKLEKNEIFELKDDSLKPQISKYFRNRDDDGI
jgi:hypothetical protein